MFDLAAALAPGITTTLLAGCLAVLAAVARDTAGRSYPADLPDCACGYGHGHNGRHHPSCPTRA